MTARGAILALVGLASSACACLDGETVRVESVSGDIELEVCAAIARTEDERRTGLRGHAPLAPGEGLLLEFPIEDEICIVNDGVSFPIDVLFADALGHVTAIERGVAASDGTPRCHAPARRVLEVAAGELEPVSRDDLLIAP